MYFQLLTPILDTTDFIDMFRSKSTPRIIKIATGNIFRGWLTYIVLLIVWVPPHLQMMCRNLKRGSEVEGSSLTSLRCVDHVYLRIDMAVLAMMVCTWL